MPKVLVVDDELEVRDFLVSTLTSESFEVLGIENGSTLLDVLKNFNPDIILMDYKMPGPNGVELVKQVRGYSEYKALPIIMVTGVDGEDEKVQALEVGADDYVVKPFLPKVLGARIRAVLRRSVDSQGAPDKLEVAGLVIDLKSHKVFLDSAEIHLTLTEFKILTELLKQKSEVLSRDKLRQSALGNLNVTDRTIDVHMASLRKKLAHLGDSIETVRGVGYRFEAK